MRLNNIEIYEFLLEQGIDNLHHANSLATSLTFIQNNGLISRGVVETMGLFQTRQVSDDDDKINKVWHDVFFDTKDLHGLFPRQNIYGPILFKFTTRILLQPDLQIYITKTNPMYWNPTIKEEDRYFQDMDDVRNNWDQYELHRKMVTVRFHDAPLPFDNLKNIIIDNPRVTIHGDTELFKECYGAINNEISKHPNLQNRLSFRSCDNRCFCQSNYLNDYGAPKLAKFFLPNNHKRFTNF